MIETQNKFCIGEIVFLNEIPCDFYYENNIAFIVSSKKPNGKYDVKTMDTISAKEDDLAKLIELDESKIFKMVMPKEIGTEKDYENIDWIFQNGKYAFHNRPNLSVLTIANEMGVNENMLWGPRGEGVDLMENITKVMMFASDYLLRNDKDGFLKACEKFKERVKNA